MVALSSIPRTIFTCIPVCWPNPAPMTVLLCGGEYLFVMFVAVTIMCASNAWCKLELD